MVVAPDPGTVSTGVTVALLAPVLQLIHTTTMAVVQNLQVTAVVAQAVRAGAAAVPAKVIAGVFIIVTQATLGTAQSVLHRPLPQLQPRLQPPPPLALAVGETDIVEGGPAEIVRCGRNIFATVLRAPGTETIAA